MPLGASATILTLRRARSSGKSQLTKYRNEQDDIQHVQAFIQSCGTYKDTLLHAASKPKLIDKMIDAGFAEKFEVDPITLLLSQFLNRSLHPVLWYIQGHVATCGIETETH